MAMELVYHLIPATVQVIIMVRIVVIMTVMVIGTMTLWHALETGNAYLQTPVLARLALLVQIAPCPFVMG